jgi:hypothetical protein
VDAQNPRCFGAFEIGGRAAIPGFQTRVYYARQFIGGRSKSPGFGAFGTGGRARRVVCARQRRVSRKNTAFGIGGRALVLV